VSGRQALFYEVLAGSSGRTEDGQSHGELAFRCLSVIDNDGALSRCVTPQP
jgi:hypothetical protein